jgi:LysM repeat protein
MVKINEYFWQNYYIISLKYFPRIYAGGFYMPTKLLLKASIIWIAILLSLTIKSGVSAAGICNRNYVVQPGDWLTKIARYCGVTLSQLYGANPNVGYYIYPGQVLLIPGGNTTTNSYCGPHYSSSNGRYYVVCRGNTLGQIARYYGVSVSYLQRHNGIINANRIYPGQVIWR